jgi:site-specific DNA-methyltransferase (adenine-specific)
MNKVTLLKGDCLQKLKELEDNSIDSVVTDPPYEIGFMGKGWDDSGIANNPELWKEVLRVLKPGGHLLSFSHSRTYHRQAVAVEDAGFQIRDQIMWIYGSGFPKSHNIGNSIDKLYGAGNRGHAISSGNRFHPTTGEPRPNGEKLDKYEARTQQGKGWEGWGTALKPAHEPIVMARKPLSEKTVAKNVLEWGTGGINIDESRIGTETRTVPVHSDDVKDDTTLFGLHPTIQHERVETTQGRFPANIIFDEEAGKILDEQSGITSQGHWPKGKTKGFGEFGGGESSYEGVGPKDKEKGGASRFFYCPKASKKDRDEGMEHLQSKTIKGRDEGQDKTSIAYKARPTERKNIHPTVKPTDLMAYLVRMVTPKGGTVLDPFMGSGSTGKASVREGMDFIGIEREDEYMEIAKTRIEHEKGKHNYRQFFDI